MKAFIFCLIPILFFACSSKEKKKIAEQNQKPVYYKTATEALVQLFETLKGTALEGFMDSIKTELPEYLEDIKYLDSMKSMKIDFIGMIHLSGDTSQVSKNVVKICQNSIDDTLNNSGYDIIATEHASHKGILNYSIMVNEIDHDARAMGNVLNQLNPGAFPTDKPLPNRAEKIFEESISCDVVFKRIKNHQRNLIGTEPRWVWITEQAINAFMQGMPDSLKGPVLKQLSDCRSEIALARTCRYLLENGPKKHAVLIYGAGHLDEFKWLATKYGLSSKFILTQPCNPY